MLRRTGSLARFPHHLLLRRRGLGRSCTFLLCRLLLGWALGCLQFLRSFPGSLLLGHLLAGGCRLGLRLALALRASLCLRLRLRLRLRFGLGGVHDEATCCRAPRGRTISRSCVAAVVDTRAGRIVFKLLLDSSGSLGVRSNSVIRGVIRFVCDSCIVFVILVLSITVVAAARAVVLVAVAVAVTIVIIGAFADSAQRQKLLRVLLRVRGCQRFAGASATLATLATLATFLGGILVVVLIAVHVVNVTVSESVQAAAWRAGHSAARRPR